MTQLVTRPLSPAVGEEVMELDISRNISESTIQALKELISVRGMIFLRNQDLTPEQQIAFAERFGQITKNSYFRAVDGYPQIAQVLKEADQKVAIGEAWHTDNSYDKRPAMGSILYAREVPPAGGDTCFISMNAAFDALSDGMKRTLRTLSAVHSTRHVFNSSRQGVEGRINTTETNHADAEHPVVISHPVSGKPCLYVNPGFTTHFSGWTPEESSALLKFLFSHSQRPDFQCRLTWQRGTIAFWDNRCTWHFAVNDYHGSRRLMHRIQIEGESLFGARE